MYACSECGYDMSECVCLLKSEERSGSPGAGDIGRSHLMSVLGTEF